MIVKNQPQKKKRPMQQEMQTARKEAQAIEQSLTRALEDYVRCDLEPGAVDVEAGGGKAQKLETEVSSLLDRLSLHIDKMEGIGNASSKSVSWKAQISRSRGILQSTQTEFRKTRDGMRQRQEKAQLLQAAQERINAESDNSLEGQRRLYDREREHIDASSQSIQESIFVAQNVKNALLDQQDRMRRGLQGLQGMAEKLPSANDLIRAATRKKLKDNIIVAVAIAVAVCFIFWWIMSA